MQSGSTISTLLLLSDPDYVLLKIAIDFAERGLNIWFISIDPFEKIPENIQQPCKEVLQLITFIYLKNYVDLIKHLNGIHKWKNIPNLIIVRDFDKYCSLHDVEYDPQKTAFLSTTLLDSILFASRKKGCATFLLVCCSELEKSTVICERLQVLHDLYFNYILAKKDSESEGDLTISIEKRFLINKIADMS